MQVAAATYYTHAQVHVCASCRGRSAHRFQIAVHDAQTVKVGDGKNNLCRVQPSLGLVKNALRIMYQGSDQSPCLNLKCRWCQATLNRQNYMVPE